MTRSLPIENDRDLNIRFLRSIEISQKLIGQNREFLTVLRAAPLEAALSMRVAALENQFALLERRVTLLEADCDRSLREALEL
ncbi:hypothetical protein LAJ19_21140 (plasmid) [Deinococcus taeanensis]|uniref:hypothetical protein n=1 Tax=Deinococcus taeanensis TaxID=2737050 RepID=UPI001CDC88B6|nr:hypothetical protein [Deinococcus taeanensis]UBV45300.1 hypothetical protein LAJ19_21140 [Deinococcus taeanensis]